MLEVLFEDNHILAVIKPAGIPSQPTDKGQNNVEDMAKDYIKNKYQKKGNVFLHPIHRLDTPVRGIIVFAKTSKALSRLQKQVREKKTLKIYEAWVEGHVVEDRGTLEDWLIHGEGKALKASPNQPTSKLCKLHYHVLKRNKEKTFIEVSLETGRYHQIRAQWAFFGHPILGDKKYGSTYPYEGPGIALNHSQFTLLHPISKEPLVLKSPFKI